MTEPPATKNKALPRLAAACVFFQGGAAAVDSSTIIATLVHGLTGSAFAVGGASAILRYGWLFPQIFVAFLAQRSPRRRFLRKTARKDSPPSLGKASKCFAATVISVFSSTPSGWEGL